MPSRTGLLASLRRLISPAARPYGRAPGTRCPARCRAQACRPGGHRCRGRATGHHRAGHRRAGHGHRARPPGTATRHGYRGCCELGTITLKGVSPHSCAVAPAVAPRPSPSSSLHGFPFDTPSPAVVVLPAARPRHDGSAQQQGEIAPGDKFALLRRGGTEPFLQPHLSQRRRYPLPSLLSRTFALH